jgi:hypothetical protein
VDSCKVKEKVSLSLSSEKYDKVYLVPQETNGVPIFNEVKLNSTNLYATYGLSDQLDVVMSLPYSLAECFTRAIKQLKLFKH